MNSGQRFALTTRADLLKEEARIVSERSLTWAGRAHELQDYGRAGGSAMDRRLIAEGMASLEAEAKAGAPDLDTFADWLERDRREPDKVLCVVQSMRRAAR